MASQSSPRAVAARAAAAPVVAPASAEARTLVVLDAGLPDLPRLLAGLSPGAHALLVPADADALGLITAALEAHAGITRLALVAHGAPGRVLLGLGGLDAQVLKLRAAELGQWGLEQIDLYACQVGQDTGFLLQLAQLSGATVAASRGVVGHHSLGGSWRLQGASNAVVPFSRASREAWVVGLVGVVGGGMHLEQHSPERTWGKTRIYVKDLLRKPNKL